MIWQNLKNKSISLILKLLSKNKSIQNNIFQLIMKMINPILKVLSILCLKLLPLRIIKYFIHKAGHFPGFKLVDPLERESKNILIKIWSCLSCTIETTQIYHCYKGALKKANRKLWCCTSNKKINRDSYSSRSS